MVWFSISPGETDGRVIQEAAHRHDIAISEGQLRSMAPFELRKFVQMLADADERLLSKQRKKRVARKIVICILLVFWVFLAYLLFSVFMPVLRSVLYQPMLGGWWVMQNSNEISFYVSLLFAGLGVWLVSWIINNF